MRSASTMKRQHARFQNKLCLSLLSLCLLLISVDRVGISEKLQNCPRAGGASRTGGTPHDSCVEERWRSPLLSHSSLSLTHAFIWDQQHLLRKPDPHQTRSENIFTTLIHLTPILFKHMHWKSSVQLLNWTSCIWHEALKQHCSLILLWLLFIIVIDRLLICHCRSV